MAKQRSVRRRDLTFSWNTWPFLTRGHFFIKKEDETSHCLEEEAVPRYPWCTDIKNSPWYFCCSWRSTTKTTFVRCGENGVEFGIYQMEAQALSYDMSESWLLQWCSAISYSGKFCGRNFLSKSYNWKFCGKKCILRLKVRRAHRKWWDSNKTMKMKRLDKYEHRHYGTMMPLITTTTSTLRHVHAHTAQRHVFVTSLLTVQSSSTIAAYLCKATG